MVTSKPCILVSKSSAWFVLSASPSPQVDQLLLLSLPLKLLPALRISTNAYKKPILVFLLSKQIFFKPEETDSRTYYHSLARLNLCTLNVRVAACR